MRLPNDETQGRRLRIGSLFSGYGGLDLAVEEVFADHDGVDGCRVLEREEREAPRATRGVAHDRARLDLAEL